MSKRPTCPSCRAPLRKKTRGKSNALGCMFGLIGMVVGLVVFVLIPIIGWVLGPLIFLAGSFATWPKREKIWSCRACRFTGLR